ncbi:DUF4132 domain-containing protein [Candidatus Uabimicrobium amorphum]|uniref:Uncharacterized protein n=1 Tax=Uabimicrobium amorphum TaxID=2596890 RepID=A0A5S9IKZ8_UABAM|nr:DUF4132 domain-containing protein [Candidatus Uabimicrobium amorphum]BBM83808.1 hypothetical protein UABAM_02163 [Candidatus Uabimicrobium amorphum]
MAQQKIGPDRFDYTNSPFALGHQFLDAFIESGLNGPGFDKKDIMQQEKPTQIIILHAALERITWAHIPKKNHFLITLVKIKHEQDYNDRIGCVLDIVYPEIETLVQEIMSLTQPYTPEDVEDILIAAVNIAQLNLKHPHHAVTPGLIPGILKHLKKKRNQNCIPMAKPLLQQLKEPYAASFLYGGEKSLKALDNFLEDSESQDPKIKSLPKGGEHWAELLISQIDKLPKIWYKLLQHAPVANRNSPSTSWLKKAQKLIKDVDDKQFCKYVGNWLSELKRETKRLQDKNAHILKGFVWYCSLVSKPPLQAIGDAVEGGLKKTPQGLVCSKIAAACFYTLEQIGTMEALMQLIRLKMRIKSPWGLEQIQLVIDKLKDRHQMTEEQIQEIAVPQLSKLEYEIAGCRAQIVITGTQTSVQWFNTSGKTQKSVPVQVKKQHPQQLKDIKKVAKDTQTMLVAQKARLERLFLADISWSYSLWQERYLNQSLLSVLTKKLIWLFKKDKRHSCGIYHDGKIIDVNGKQIKWLDKETTVQLWHPIGFSSNEVLKWREFLEHKEIVQPFKQAHREVYIITDAEFTTDTYSNRFAAHIIKQHLLTTLCQQRNWQYDVLGSWDSGDAGVARLKLEKWNLTAEFMIHYSGDDSTSPAGVINYVSTDRVHFVGAEDYVRLCDVPAFIFSEVMRDIDLFVSISSIGNDPQWQDGDHYEYWESYSFGDLSESAAMRKDTLERLIPKLKIADVCSIEGKYLYVKGKIRHYKIHLGSGNILMAPNDQYLCIVQDVIKQRKQGNVFLPFAGDNRLALILSKAFMLAADDKIKDKTILAQIEVNYPHLVPNGT